MSTERLTARQSQCLAIIQNHLITHGMPPTMREIMAHMGIVSTNGVSDHLRALERKGYLTTDNAKSRGIRLTTAENCCPTCGQPIGNLQGAESK